MSVSDKFITDALEILEEKREIYDDAGAKLCSFFEDELSLSSLNIISITSRTKGKESLKEKIFRKNYFMKYQTGSELISKLSDGIGIRITCLLSEDEEKIYQSLKKIFFDVKTIDDENFYFDNSHKYGISYSDQPEKQVNGQPIYRIDGVIVDETGKIFYELQIKSLVHCLWGEVEHSLFYKKFDYIISNNYYAQLMQSMDKELENVDSQIGALKSHLEQNDLDQSKNVREIAAYLLSKRCKDLLSSSIGCDIDLREVYDVIVDLDFLYIGDTNQEIKKLNEFISKCPKCDGIKEYYSDLESGKLEKNEIAPKYVLIVEMIDDKIKAGDIYWKSFAAIYMALSTEHFSYSAALNSMVHRLTSMIEGNIEIDKVADQKLSDELGHVVRLALEKTACEVGKIGFYSIRNNIDFLMNKYIQIVDELQMKVNSQPSVDVFTANSNTIIYYLQAMLFNASRNKPDADFIKSLVSSINEHNDYSLNICRDITSWLGCSEEEMDLLADSLEA